MDDRRRFLRRALGALFAALFAVPGIAALLDPALRRAGARWIDAGPADAVRPGAAVRFAWDVASGWESVKETGYLVRDGPGIVALSARCTHFGCRVKPGGGAGAAEFRCPCHGGRFSLGGAPLGGPPDTPLRRFEVRVDDGRVRVKV